MRGKLRRMKSNLYADGLALAAIALWGTLASLGVSLAHVPPFLLTGLSLLIGSLIALPPIDLPQPPPKDQPLPGLEPKDPKSKPPAD